MRKIIEAFAILLVAVGYSLMWIVVFMPIAFNQGYGSLTPDTPAWEKFIFLGVGLWLVTIANLVFPPYWATRNLLRVLVELRPPHVAIPKAG